MEMNNVILDTDQVLVGGGSEVGQLLMVLMILN